MRVGYVRISQETNAFSPLETTIEDFERLQWLDGDALDRVCGPMRHEVPGWVRNAELSGFVWATRHAPDVERVPLFSAWAFPSGPLAADAYAVLQERLGAALRAAGPLHGLLFSLHGAMRARGAEAEPEEGFLRTVREVLGDRVPVATTVDLHAQLTPGKVEPSTILTAYRTNPHRDLFRCGRRAGELLIDTIRGRIRPVSAWRTLPLVSGGGTGFDFQRPMRPVFRHMRAMERRPGVLCCNLCMVHPFNDSRDLGWSTHVVTDADPVLAEELAEELAELAWSARTVPWPQGQSLADGLGAVREAWLARRLGTVCLVDMSDAVGAGGTGANTALLRALLEGARGLRAYVPVRDPEAVASIWDRAEGTAVRVRVGGRVDPRRHPAVDVAGTLVRKHRNASGRAAVLDLGDVQLVITEGAPFTLKPTFYTDLGLDPWKADLVVVKSLFHFRLYFAAVNRKTIAVRSAGATDLGLVTSLEFNDAVYPAQPVADWRVADRRRRGLPAPAPRAAADDGAAPLRSGTFAGVPDAAREVLMKRLDGARPAVADDMRLFMPMVMPSRSGSALFFHSPIEVGAVLGFLEAHNARAADQLRIFHVVLAAMVRTLGERPQLNRYVLGGQLMERDSISLTFAVKKGKRDDARIVSTKVRFEPTDTLEQVRAKVDAAILASRNPHARTTAEREMAVLNRLPRGLVRGLMRAVDGLHERGLLPASMLASDPTQTSAFVANLGSIGLDASYHHLSDHGTASVHATVGEVRPRWIVGEDRQARVADVLDVKFAIDDRICDGFYCARSLQRLEHWLRHPAALMEARPDRPDLVPGRLFANALAVPEEAAYWTRSPADDAWYATTWLTFADDVRAVARALVALGVQPGDRVAIQGANRPEWTAYHLAAMTIGAVPAGLHEDLPPDELRALLTLAEPKAVLLETTGNLPLVRQHLGSDVALAIMAPRPTEGPAEDVVYWDDLLEQGRRADDGEVERRLARVRGDDPAVLVFTSGTTGRPRGVVLTHANVASTATSAVQMLGIDREDRAISYLPLSHIAEQSLTIYAAVTAAAATAYAVSRASIFDALKELRPTVFFGVPQVWVRLQRDAESALAEHDGAALRWARKRAAAACARPGRAQGLADRAGLAAARQVLRPVLAVLGLDRVRYAVCGAAAVDPSVVAFFESLGLPILETYGQSEGAGVSTFQRPASRRAGNAGTAFPGVSVRIAGDGEVEVRGPNVFRGYWRDEEASARAFTPDGWLRSGDVGTLDAVGRLTIIDRKKEILVTSGGEKIAPAPLEAALTGIPLVQQAVVLGHARPFLSALIAVDQERAVAWLEARGRGPIASVGEHPALVAELESALAAFNRGRDRASQIKAWRQLPRPLSVEDGELTPTGKVRREVVEERHARLVASIYRPGDVLLTPFGPDVADESRAGFTARPAAAHELDALFALRYRSFLQQGLIDPRRWPDERMKDRFDDRAIHFALRDPNGDLAGTARLVTGAQDGLPVFDLFDFERVAASRDRTGEVGRLAIEKAWRGRRTPLVVLIRTVMAHAEALGLTYAYAFVPSKAIRAYAALGCTVWPLKMHAPTAATLDRRLPMAPYFEKQDPRVIVFTSSGVQTPALPPA
jgi:long-chain acyl-CoA synthetase